MKNLILTFIFAVVFIAVPISSLDAYVAQEGIWKDLDRDGYTESLVFYEGKLIRKILVDTNHDGKLESVIFYKNGYRDHAERDLDLNGRADIWMSYYFTGVPWKIAKDRNGDGVADIWEYVRDGMIYKWELDRNFDGKADIRIAYDLPHLTSAKASGKEILKQLHDNDFDGIFEEVSVSAEGRAPMSSGAGEALMRA